MAITTYTELKSTVADWLNRSDLESAIPSFISLAEAELNRRLRVPQMTARADAVIESQYTALPSDLISMKSLYLQTNPVTQLEFVSVEEMARMKSEVASTYTAKPTHFSIVGQTIEVWPLPNGNFTAELVYYARVPSLSASVASNWLLSASPDAYLYGALMHSAPYLKDDERAGLWATAFEKSIEQINLAGERAEFSGGAIRARVARSY